MFSLCCCGPFSVRAPSLQCWPHSASHTLGHLCHENLCEGGLWWDRQQTGHCASARSRGQEKRQGPDCQGQAPLGRLSNRAVCRCAGLGCAACVTAPPHDARHRAVGIQLTEGDRPGSECCPLLSDLRGWVQVRRRCARPSVPGEWAGGWQWSLCLELL